MDLTQLITFLKEPTAYPTPVHRIEIRQTHISVVVITDTIVYKIKKPVELGFLDFSSLELRRHFCLEEVRLNRRLAPSVYLDVVPIAKTGTGVYFEGKGEIVEWAVKMRRLPDEVTFQKRLLRKEIAIDQVQRLAERIAAFHETASRGEDISNFGRFEVIANNARDNYHQTTDHVGLTISLPVFDRLRELTDYHLNHLRPIIERRARNGIPCDTHGDLHLDHIYYFPEKIPPDDLLIIDCIEFNERFRFADPIADMAFVVMDFISYGRADLSNAFAFSYLQKSGDQEGNELIPFYTAYRAAIRAKVEGIKAFEPEIPQPRRTLAIQQAKAYWLLALGALEQPEKKPCIVLLVGLPGSGKSTIADSLNRTALWTLLRTNRIRKDLANNSQLLHLPAGFGEGIYSSAWTQLTYSTFLKLTEESLLEGKRVLVDACFVKECYRRDFLTLAKRYAVPALIVYCRAEPEVIYKRLERRQGDVSDANWTIYSQMAAQWEPFSAETEKVVHIFDATSSPESLANKVSELVRRIQYFSEVTRF